MVATSNVIFPQSLTPPLAQKEGSIQVTSEWLLALPFNQEVTPSIHWLNEEDLILGKHSSIERIHSKTGRCVFSTEGSNPKPSPNGEWIAFIKEMDNKKQLFLMDNDGAECEPIIELENGLTGGFNYHYGFSWSPCGKYIALHHQVYLPNWQRDAKVENDPDTTSALSIDKLRMTSPNSEIIIIDIDLKTHDTLLTLDSSIRNITWSSDSKTIFFMSDKVGRYYCQFVDKAWIFSLDLNDKCLKKILEFDGLQQFLDPVISPDDQRIAFTYDVENPLFTFMTSLGLVDVQDRAEKSTKDIVRLSQQLKLIFPKWSHDGEFIYVLRDYGAYRQIYSINSKTKKVKQLTAAPLNIEDYAISPNGSQLAWIGQDCHAKMIIRKATNEGENVSDIAVIPATPSHMALSEVREIDWNVPNHTEKMRGLLVLPLHYKPNKRYPLIVDIHGGGPGAHIWLRGGILVNSPLEWQLWAAKGYAVFIPEFRSSSAFGALDIVKETPDLINDDISDIVAGVDELILKEIIDSQRIAVIGHSAGGRRVNWLIVSTNKFKTAISKEGWADEWFMTGVEERNLIYSIYGGHPALAPQNYQKNSSLYHANKATTPTLFLMGNAKIGGIDQYDTVRWLYFALKAQGIPSEYIQYPDEGHNFQRLANQRDALERSINWIDMHLS